METRFSDTAQQSEGVMIEMLRKISPEARLETALEFTEILRKLIESGVRVRHPEYSDKEVKLAVIRIILGEKLFKKVYPEYKEIKP